LLSSRRGRRVRDVLGCGEWDNGRRHGYSDQLQLSIHLMQVLSRMRGWEKPWLFWSITITHPSNAGFVLIPLFVLKIV
jgi:hypothetical protein